MATQCVADALAVAGHLGDDPRDETLSLGKIRIQDGCVVPENLRHTLAHVEEIADLPLDEMARLGEVDPHPTGALHLPARELGALDQCRLDTVEFGLDQLLTEVGHSIGTAELLGDHGVRGLPRTQHLLHLLANAHNSLLWE